MKSKHYARKSWIILCTLLLVALLPAASAASLADIPYYLPLVANGEGTLPPPSEAIVIDHRHTNAQQIPAAWIEEAKKLTVHYAHTSHGGQILEGMRWLEAQDSKFNVAVTTAGSPRLPADTTALRIYDGNNYGSNSYITPELYWESESGREHTRSVLTTGLFDISLWTWCGQMSYYEQSSVKTYLDTLAQFGSEYPAVKMVYYTGHTDGSAPGSDLWRNNTLVRQYAQQHSNAVLFDFADIESYDPAGNFYPNASDSCAWCQNWCQAHPQNFECQELPGCAHSDGLQCTLKAQAYWWMLARLAGWDGNPE